MKILAAFLAISLLVGCDPKATGPVPIASGDACAFCRMLISERRYSAELLDTDGTVYKFDDIACMMRFAKSHNKNSPAVRFYVTDYSSGRDWLDARQAYFVRRTGRVSSPMVSGWIAFRSPSAAARATSTGSVAPIRLDELWAQNL